MTSSNRRHRVLASAGALAALLVAAPSTAFASGGGDGERAELVVAALAFVALLAVAWHVIQRGAPDEDSERDRGRERRLRDR